jgi:hypothetical protein
MDTITQHRDSIVTASHSTVAASHSTAPHHTASHSITQH